MTVLTTVLFGVVFGLALAAPPGPMNAIIAEESVLRGWKAGFKAGLGAMVADVLFFSLALIGVVAFIQRFPQIREILIFIGGLLMLYFAYGAVQGATRQFRSAQIPESRGFSKAFVLSLTNPYQILFWLTAGVELLTPGRIDMLAYANAALSGILVVETGHPALVLGLFGGIAIWIVGFPAALSAAESRLDSLAPIIAYGSAVVLAGFGVYFLFDVLTL